MLEKLLAKSATKTSAAQTIIEHTNHLIKNGKYSVKFIQMHCQRKIGTFYYKR